jgi:hypothetical protein
MILASDISGVPAEYVKNFFIMLAFVIGLWAAHRKGTQAKGTKAEPLNIAMPVDVRHVEDFALKKETNVELEKLGGTIQAMARENLRQHEQAGQRIQSVIKAGSEREGSIINAMHEMETRFTKLMLAEMKTIHERLNPLSQIVASHTTGIAALEQRLSDLWGQVQQLWTRIINGKPAR